MSNAVAGVGTQFRRWNTSTEQWDVLAEINSISGPSMTRATYDVTNLDSTGGYREFIPGFRDGGTVTLNMNFTRATYETIKNDYESDTLQNYEIVLPDTEETTMEFEGFVTECPWDIPTDDKITANATIKVSGQPVLNSGASSGLT